MIVFYTGADEIAVIELLSEQLKDEIVLFECFVLLLKLLMYILNPYEEGYFF